MTTMTTNNECWFCGGGVSDEDFCHGCREYICSRHSDAPWGSHSPADHEGGEEDDDDDE